MEQLSLLVDYMKPAENQISLAQNSHHVLVLTGGGREEGGQPKIKNTHGERYSV